jgi:hypothetical protein
MGVRFIGAYLTFQLVRFTVRPFIADRDGGLLPHLFTITLVPKNRDGAKA